MTDQLPPPLPGLDAVKTGRWTIVLPWETPPLTLNQRFAHPAQQWALVKKVRSTAALLARSQRIPPLGRCRVTLTWYVRTKHRRDADNVTATLKALCDGLVDAGIVTDDTPDLMDKRMPVITYRPGVAPAVEILIEAVDP